MDLLLARDEGMLSLSVADHGEGIEPAFLPYVFDRLRQAEGSQKRSGLGLGLAIARGFTEAMGGSVRTEPTEGGGTTVVLTLRTAP